MPVGARRERASLFCARRALDTPARGRSTSPLGRMDTSLWASIAAGVFAGLLAVSAAGRWLRVVGGLRQEAGAQVRIAGIPLLAFVHPTPWLCFIGLPVAAYYFVHVRASSNGARFFSALGTVVLVWLVASALVIAWAIKTGKWGSAMRPNNRSRGP